jgi:hypothetical protein
MSQWPASASAWVKTNHSFPARLREISGGSPQFGATFDRYGALRRQRNDIEYPLVVAASLTPDDARSAIAVATELADAADQLLPHLGLFGSRSSPG